MVPPISTPQEAAGASGRVWCLGRRRRRVRLVDRKRPARLPKSIEAFKAFTGLKFKILFFDKISAPILITVYGPLLGTFVGLIGSALPAISSRKVKVSEVFAQVT